MTESLSDRLGALLDRMQESDRRLQELINKHVDDTYYLLDDLRHLVDEAPSD